MPQFIEGESKTATILFSNPTEVTFDYSVVVYLGVNAVVSSLQEFNLVSGQQKSVDFSLNMPAVAGTYEVFIDVYVGGILLKHYQANESIVIIVAPVSDPGYINFAVAGVNWRDTMVDWNSTIRVGPFWAGYASIIAEGGNRYHPLDELIHFRVRITGNMTHPFYGDFDVDEFLWHPYPTLTVEIGGNYRTGPTSGAQIYTTFGADVHDGDIIYYNDGG